MENQNTPPVDRYDKLEQLYDNMERERAEEADESIAAANKKKEKVTIAIVLGIMGVLIATLLVVVFLLNKKKDEKIVAKAFVQMAKDYSELQEEEFFSASEIETLVNEVIYGDSKFIYSLNISDVPNLPLTLGVDGITNRTYEYKKLSSLNDLSVMNADISELNLYADGNVLYVEVPALLDKAIMADTEDFAKKFNSSEIVQLFNLTIPDADYRIFKDGEKKEIKVVSSTEIEDTCKDAFVGLAKTMEASHEKTKYDFELPDGSVSCTQYNVILDGSKFEELINGMLEAYDKPSNVSVADNVNLTVLIDDNKQIRKILTKDKIYIDGVGIYFDVRLEGSDIAVTSTIANIAVDKTENDKDINPVIEYLSGENYSISFSIDEDDEITAYVRGTGEVNADIFGVFSLKHDQVASIYDFKIKGFDISQDNKKMIHLSGDLTVDVRNIAVDTPPGEYIDILNMNLMDMIGMVSDITSKWDKYKDIADMFGGLF